MTPGDPLAPAPDAPPHESGLPGYEPDRPQSAPGGYSGGYSSPPPPGAFGRARHGPTRRRSRGQYQLAGWWSRAGAALIDGLIVSVGALIILAVFGSVFSVGFFASEETGVAALVVGLMLSFLAIAIVALLYAPLMMDRTNGKTLGRMAMGIRVVRANGQRDDVRLGDAARGRGEVAAVRLRRIDHVRARQRSPTTSGRCGTTRTARCTTSSSTRASCATERQRERGPLGGRGQAGRPRSR